MLSRPLAPYQTPLLFPVDIILVSGHLCLLLAKSSAARRFWCSPVHGGEDQCLEEILQNPLTQAGETKNYGSLPIVLGGIGLRSATRTSAPAYWASWSEGTSRDAVLEAAAEARRELVGVMGFEPPFWQAMSDGARPPLREPEDVEKGTVRRGWQHEACFRAERHFREELFEQASAQVKALVRSQGGAGAGAALSVAPTHNETTLPSHLFRVILLRRLRQALLLCAFWCRCGRLLDACGHHGAACSHAGVLNRSGFALENILARICREARGRVRTNVMFRDMDLPKPDVQDGRRLEVVVDGFPLRRGAQLAGDTTMVCAWHRDGRPRRRAERDGLALGAARRKRETTHTELLGPRRRAQLVVIEVEVGGRWSRETRSSASLPDLVPDVSVP